MFVKFIATFALLVGLTNGQGLGTVTTVQTNVCPQGAGSSGSNVVLKLTSLTGRITSSPPYTMSSGSFLIGMYYDPVDVATVGPFTVAATGNWGETVFPPGIKLSFPVTGAPEVALPGQPSFAWTFLEVDATVPLIAYNMTLTAQVHGLALNNIACRAFDVTLKIGTIV